MRDETLIKYCIVLYRKRCIPNSGKYTSELYILIAKLLFPSNLSKPLNIIEQLFIIPKGIKGGLNPKKNSNIVSFIKYINCIISFILPIVLALSFPI